MFVKAANTRTHHQCVSPGAGACCSLLLLTCALSNAVQRPPTRDEDGFVNFGDAPDFRPNLTPAEVLRRGSFGGGYYRTISSAATGMVHKDAHREFPAGWFEGIHVGSLVTSNVYRPSANKYGKKCGRSKINLLVSPRICSRALMDCVAPHRLRRWWGATQSISALSERQPATFFLC